ncbi:MAG: MoxR family ATPase [candidate division NC10 bacterium]|nr:MoxR family ATPase [candidate division NC10 bacterium]
MTAEEKAERFRQILQAIEAEIGGVIVGHQEVIRGVLICLSSGGHALLEGVPGLGKTILVKTLSRCLDLEFSRVQFTPDLMPADIIGTNIIVETPEGRQFRFQKGPLFGQIVLADEINRATPKTQSALLEAMQELSVTVGGVQHRLKLPFCVLATQNPIEMEGTYPLPEAQLDRFFFKLKVSYPTEDELSEIVERTTKAEEVSVKKVMGAEEVEAMKAFIREIPIASHVKAYASRLILTTHPETPSSPELVKRFVRYGSSPRGAQALVLAGKVNALLSSRFNVSFDDIRDAALPALRHRLIFSFEGEAEGIDPDRIIEEVLKNVPTEEPKRTVLSGR